MITNTRREKNRKKVRARSLRARLSVFRSNKYVYAQVIDDRIGKTVAEAHGTNATEVGDKVAQMAIKKGTKEVVFDRGEYKYHGKVKLIAEAARKAGLVF